MNKMPSLFCYLTDLSAWISWPHYNPFSPWSTVTYRHQSYKTSCRFLQDGQTHHLYLAEPRSLVRLKHALLLLADLTVHTVGILVVMVRDLLCCGLALTCALWTLLCGQGSLFLAYSQLTIKLAISMAAKPLCWLGMLTSNILGVLFLPYGCRKVYASLERDAYQDAFIAPCFQPILDHSNPSRKPRPIAFFPQPQTITPLKTTDTIPHLFGSEANKAGW